jgi:hypothetical protein
MGAPSCAPFAEPSRPGPVLQEPSLGPSFPPILHPTVHRDFCNRTVLREDWEAQNVSVAARCRKDIVLCKRAPGKGRQYYRQPAYLLTADLRTDALVLLQAYFDRWGIEVNRRDEKDISVSDGNMTFSRTPLRRRRPEQLRQIHHAVLDSQDFDHVVVPAIKQQVARITAHD